MGQGWIDAPGRREQHEADHPLDSSNAPPAQLNGRAGVGAERAQEHPPGRRAVNFDVESLFAGESSPPESQADDDVDDSAKTRAMDRYQVESSADYIPRSSMRVPQWAYVAAPIALALLWLMFRGEDEAATENPPPDKSSVAAKEATPTTQAPREQPAVDEKPAAPAQAANVEAEAEEVPAQDDDSANADNAEDAKDQQAAAEDAKADLAHAADSAPEESSPSSAAARKRRVAPIKAKLKEAGPSADELKVQARQAYAAKHYAEAAKLYEQVTKMSSRDAGAFAGLGASQLASGNKKGAVASYQRAVQLQPKSSGFQAALGRAYYENGDKARSIASYRKALELNPDNGAAKAALARLQ